MSIYDDSFYIALIYYRSGQPVNFVFLSVFTSLEYSEVQEGIGVMFLCALCPDTFVYKKPTI